MKQLVEKQKREKLNHLKASYPLAWQLLFAL
jgi:hypothetical protein